MLRYVLHPGFVISQHDGQQHYIGPMTLARLYGVDIKQCVIYEPAPWWPSSFYDYERKRHEGLIHLTPRNDGKYDIPKY